MRYRENTNIHNRARRLNANKVSVVTSDVNECTKGTHSCDVDAVCHNTRGSYHCTCKEGFYGDGKTCTGN